MHKTVKSVLRRAVGRRGYAALKRRFGSESFLRRVSGVIHVGANVGQERETYEEYGVEVLWFEPLPEVFEELQRNIQPYQRQRALRCLLADRVGQEYSFHIANNQGASSSLFELGRHAELHPEVSYVNTIPMVSSTLDAVMERERIDPGRYQALILDTQGSELLVLRGAAELLPRLRYVRTEAADHESYAGGCILSEISTLLAVYGFREKRRDEFERLTGVGAYYEVLYERVR
jgi:FkbM family methyltransferase